MRIVVDTSELHARAAVLRRLSIDLRDVRVGARCATGGSSVLVDAALGAIYTSLREALPPVAAELSQVAGNLDAAAAAYSKGEGSAARG